MTPVAAAVATLAFGVSCLLLFAGSWKATDPRSTREALRTAGLPSGALPVRLMAATEVVVGVALIVSTSWVWYAAAAALFLGFFGFVLQARLRNLPLRTCGCFGRADSPVSLTHLVVTPVLAVAMAAAAIVGYRSVALVSPLRQRSALTPILGLAAAILVYALLEPLAALRARIRATQLRTGRAA